MGFGQHYRYNKWMVRGVLMCCPFTSLFIDDTLLVLVRSDRVNVDPLLVIMAKEVVKSLLCADRREFTLGSSLELLFVDSCTGSGLNPRQVQESSVDGWMGIINSVVRLSSHAYLSLRDDGAL